GYLVSWVDFDGLTVDAQRYDRFGHRVGGQFRLVNHEFDVNPPFKGTVAFAPAGGFVAAYGLSFDGDSPGVFAQRYDASGVRVVSELRVNTYTTGLQFLPSVIRDPEGGFVIAWESLGQEGFEALALAQRFDASGNRLGGEFRLGSQNQQSRPTLVRTADGGFVAPWGSSDGVLARRLYAA